MIMKPCVINIDSYWRTCGDRHIYVEALDLMSKDAQEVLKYLGKKENDVFNESKFMESLVRLLEASSSKAKMPLLDFTSKDALRRVYASDDIEIADMLAHNKRFIGEEHAKTLMANTQKMYLHRLFSHDLPMLRNIVDSIGSYNLSHEVSLALIDIVDKLMLTKENVEDFWICMLISYNSAFRVDEAAINLKLYEKERQNAAKALEENSAKLSSLIAEMHKEESTNDVYEPEEDDLY